MVTVLIVDDDHDIRLTLRMVLEEIAAISIEEARDGQEGLQILRHATAPYIVLLDFMMPQFDGAYVLEQIASDATLNRHRFIVMTARDKTLPLKLERIRQMLGIPLVPKPFDIDQIVRIVEQQIAEISR